MACSPYLTLLDPCTAWHVSFTKTMLSQTGKHQGSETMLLIHFLRQMCALLTKYGPALHR